MAKKKAGNQISNLTPDHKKSDESYNFALELISIGGLIEEL
jgi:hypothetical protein